MKSIQNIIGRIQEIKERFHGFSIAPKTKNNDVKNSSLVEGSSSLLQSEAVPLPLSVFATRKTLAEGSFRATLDKELSSEVSNKSKIQTLVKKASHEHKVPEGLIDAMIKNESDYNPWAISSKGAQGLMQLMPSTAKELGVTKPFDLAQNIDGGTRYLRKLLERYDGDYIKAVAAYNAGPANVVNGIPEFKETKSYVKKVMDLYLKNNGVR